MTSYVLIKTGDIMEKNIADTVASLPMPEDVVILATYRLHQGLDSAVLREKDDCYDWKVAYAGCCPEHDPNYPD